MSSQQVIPFKQVADTSAALVVSTPSPLEVTPVEVKTQTYRLSATAMIVVQSLRGCVNDIRGAAILADPAIGIKGSSSSELVRIVDVEVESTSVAGKSEKLLFKAVFHSGRPGRAFISSRAFYELWDLGVEVRKMRCIGCMYCDNPSLPKKVFKKECGLITSGEFPSRMSFYPDKGDSKAAPGTVGICASFGRVPRAQFLRKMGLIFTQFTQSELRAALLGVPLEYKEPVGLLVKGLAEIPGKKEVLLAMVSSPGLPLVVLNALNDQLGLKLVPRTVASPKPSPQPTVASPAAVKGGKVATKLTLPPATAVSAPPDSKAAAPPPVPDIFVDQLRSGEVVSMKMDVAQRAWRVSRAVAEATSSDASTINDRARRIFQELLTTFIPTDGGPLTGKDAIGYLWRAAYSLMPLRVIKEIASGKGKHANQLQRILLEDERYSQRKDTGYQSPLTGAVVKADGVDELRGEYVDPLKESDEHSSDESVYSGTGYKSVMKIPPGVFTKDSDLYTPITAAYPALPARAAPPAWKKPPAALNAAGLPAFPPLGNVDSKHSKPHQSAQEESVKAASAVARPSRSTNWANMVEEEEQEIKDAQRSRRDQTRAETDKRTVELTSAAATAGVPLPPRFASMPAEEQQAFAELLGDFTAQRKALGDVDISQIREALVPRGSSLMSTVVAYDYGAGGATLQAILGKSGIGTVADARRATEQGIIVRDVRKGISLIGEHIRALGDIPQVQTTYLQSRPADFKDVKNRLGPYYIAGEQVINVVPQMVVNDLDDPQGDPVLHVSKTEGTLEFTIEEKHPQYFLDFDKRGPKPGYFPTYQTFEPDHDVLTQARTQDALVMKDHLPDQLRVYKQVVDVVDETFFGTTSPLAQVGRLDKNSIVSATSADLMNPLTGAPLSYDDYLEFTAGFPLSAFPYTFVRQKKFMPLDHIELLYGPGELGDAYREGLYLDHDEQTLRTARYPVWDSARAAQEGFSAFKFNPRSAPGPMFNLRTAERLTHSTAAPSEVAIANQYMEELGNATTRELFSAFMKKWDFLRLAKVVPKPEVYPVDKKLVNRNIFATNTAAYLPAFVAMNAAVRGIKPPLDGANRVLYGFSPAHGMTQTLLERMVSRPAGQWDYLVYADNLYLFRPHALAGSATQSDAKDKKDQTGENTSSLKKKLEHMDLDWVSMDGSSMEASHKYRGILYAFHRLAEQVFGVPREVINKSLSQLLPLRPGDRKDPGDSGSMPFSQAIRSGEALGIDNSFFMYLTRLLPMFATSTIGLLGNAQISVQGLASGVAPTFWANTDLMTICGSLVAEALNSGSELLDSDKDGVSDDLKSLISPLGLVLKVESKVLVADSKQGGLLGRARAGEIVPMDLLGYDLKFLSVGNYQYYVSVLNKQRLLRSLVYSKAGSDMENTELPGPEARLLVTVFSWQKFKALYIQGGWAYPEIAELIRGLCEHLGKVFPRVMEPSSQALIRSSVEIMFQNEGFVLDGQGVSELAALISQHPFPFLSDVFAVMFPPTANLVLREAAKHNEALAQAFPLDQRPKTSVRKITLKHKAKKPIISETSVPLSGIHLPTKEMSGHGLSKVVKPGSAAEQDKSAGRFSASRPPTISAGTDKEVSQVASRMVLEANKPFEERSPMMYSSSWAESKWSEIPRKNRMRMVESWIAFLLRITKANVEQAGAKLLTEAGPTKEAWERLIKEGAPQKVRT